MPIWQGASAAGWGHTFALAMAANDAVAAAVSVADDPGLLLACDGADGRSLACATLRMNNGVATLCGMSTRPEERGRGARRP